MAKVSTKEKILEAAAVVFSEHGFAGASIRNICAKAAVNISAVSYYFRSKEQLYMEVHKYLHVSCDHDWEWTQSEPVPQPDAASWLAELRRIMRCILQAGLRSDKLGACRRKILFQEMVKPSKCLPILADTFYRPINDYLTKYLRMAAPEADSLKISVMCSLLMNFVMGFMRMTPPWEKIACPEGVTLEQWAERYIQEVTEAVAKALKESSSPKENLP